MNIQIERRCPQHEGGGLQHLVHDVGRRAGQQLLTPPHGDPYPLDHGPDQSHARDPAERRGVRGGRQPSNSARNPTHDRADQNRREQRHARPGRRHAQRHRELRPGRRAGTTGARRLGADPAAGRAGSRTALPAGRPRPAPLRHPKAVARMPPTHTASTPPTREAGPEDAHRLRTAAVGEVVGQHGLGGRAGTKPRVTPTTAARDEQMPVRSGESAQRGEAAPQRHAAGDDGAAGPQVRQHSGDQRPERERRWRTTIPASPAGCP